MLTRSVFLDILEAVGMALYCRGCNIRDGSSFCLKEALIILIDASVRVVPDVVMVGWYNLQPQHRGKRVFQDK